MSVLDSTDKIKYLYAENSSKGNIDCKNIENSPKY